LDPRSDSGSISGSVDGSRSRSDRSRSASDRSSRSRSDRSDGHSSRGSGGSDDGNDEDDLSESEDSEFADVLDESFHSTPAKPLSSATATPATAAAATEKAGPRGRAPAAAWASPTLQAALQTTAGASAAGVGAARRAAAAIDAAAVSSESSDEANESEADASESDARVHADTNDNEDEAADNSGRRARPRTRLRAAAAAAAANGGAGSDADDDADAGASTGAAGGRPTGWLSRAISGIKGVFSWRAGAEYSDAEDEAADNADADAAAEADEGAEANTDDSADVATGARTGSVTQQGSRRASRAGASLPAAAAAAAAETGASLSVSDSFVSSGSGSGSSMTASSMSDRSFDGGDARASAPAVRVSAPAAGTRARASASTALRGSVSGVRVSGSRAGTALANPSVTSVKTEAAAPVARVRASVSASVSSSVAGAAAAAGSARGSRRLDSAAPPTVTEYEAETSAPASASSSFSLFSFFRKPSVVDTAAAPVAALPAAAAAATPAQAAAADGFPSSFYTSSTSASAALAASAAASASARRYDGVPAVADVSRPSFQRACARSRSPPAVGTGGGGGGDGDDSDDLSGDDAEGFISVQPGTTLLDRYYVIDRAGKGTFGTVLDVYDLVRRRRIALKVVRSVRRYLDAAKTEVDIVLRLQLKDPAGESGCVRLVKHFTLDFDRQRHMCIGFEKLGLSLYSFSKRNGHRGFRLCDVRRIAFQLLISLAFCHQEGLVHTDLKPENILLQSSRYGTSVLGEPTHIAALARLRERVGKDEPVGSSRSRSRSHSRSRSSSSRSRDRSDSRSNSSGDGGRNRPDTDEQEQLEREAGTYTPTPLRRQLPAPYRVPLDATVRLIDFGAATFPEHRHTSIIATRQYRPPEVILRLGWGYASDVWSAACILLELFTGELLFATHDDLEHLALMERVLRRALPADMLARAYKESAAGGDAAAGSRSVPSGGNSTSGRSSSSSSSSNSSSSGSGSGGPSYPARDWDETRRRSGSTLRATELVRGDTYGLRWPENAVDAPSYYVVKDALTLHQCVFAGAESTLRPGEALPAFGRTPVPGPLVRAAHAAGLPVGAPAVAAAEAQERRQQQQEREQLALGHSVVAAAAPAGAAPLVSASADAGGSEAAGPAPAAAVRADCVANHHPPVEELTAFYELLDLMLAYDPANRPSAKAALGHRFFAAERVDTPPPKFLWSSAPLPPHRHN
jgi:serine/threonine protein kinase